MKSKLIATSLIIAGLFILGCISATDEHSKKESETQAALMARAKISESQARATALGRASNGDVRESGLEVENGRLIWSFDIATPGTKNITEVQVDAVTGDVVAVAIETAADEVKEAKAEKKKGEKEDDDEKDEPRGK